MTRNVKKNEDEAEKGFQKVNQKLDKIAEV